MDREKTKLERGLKVREERVEGNNREDEKVTMAR